METLTEEQIERISSEVSIMTDINDVIFWITERFDFSGQKYYTLRTDDFLSSVDAGNKLSTLQLMIYSAFWFEIEFRIEPEKIHCSLRCRYDLKSGGNNGYTLRLFSIDANIKN